MKLFWKIMRFLVCLYYTQPFYRTSTFGQNHAYCIQILTVIIEIIYLVQWIYVYVWYYGKCNQYVYRFKWCCFYFGLKFQCFFVQNIVISINLLQIFLIFWLFQRPGAIQAIYLLTYNFCAMVGAVGRWAAHFCVFGLLLCTLSTKNTPCYT